MLVAGSIGTSHAVQKKGDSDIQFAGSFIHAQGAESGILNLDLGYGYFVTDNWEIGILQTVGYSFIDDADDEATGTIGPQVGFKSFITDSTYIMAKYRYEWFFEELSINEVEDTSSDGNHVVTFGVGFVF